ncbi:hypothetical protein ACFL5T_05185 [Gemmatimonadota bacterium]
MINKTELGNQEATEPAVAPEAHWLHIYENIVIGTRPARNAGDEAYRLVPEFVPTRAELEELARRYLAEYYSYEEAWLLEGLTGGGLMERQNYVVGRLRRIKEHLGEESFKRATAEIESDWVEFLSSTPLYVDWEEPVRGGPAPSGVRVAVSWRG